MPRPSDYESLRRRLEEVEQQVKDERLRAEQAEQRALEAKKTTLQEFLRYCHIYLCEPMVVETRKRKSTSGYTVNPRGRCYPTKFLPWDSFEGMQYKTFQRLLTIFHPESQPAAQLFDAKATVESKGVDACREKLASEEDLRSYLEKAVQNPVQRIIDALSGMPQEEWNIAGGIEFTHHHNPLNQDETEAEASTVAVASIRVESCRSRSTDEQSRKLPKDKICVHIPLRR
jgi:hypothetical protein